MTPNSPRRRRVDRGSARRWRACGRSRLRSTCSSHAGIDQVPGGFVGVDVFFVISGFLITGLLVREAESTGRVDLVRFWARRAKRLLPASALPLTVTALASWFLLPATSWRDVGGDIAASARYVVNWRFAAEAVGSTAEGAGISPVPHFWSLAV